MFTTAGLMDKITDHIREVSKAINAKARPTELHISILTTIIHQDSSLLGCRHACLLECQAEECLQGCRLLSVLQGDTIVRYPKYLSTCWTSSTSVTAWIPKTARYKFRNIPHKVLRTLETFIIIDVPMVEHSGFPCPWIGHWDPPSSIIYACRLCYLKSWRQILEQ